MGKDEQTICLRNFLELFRSFRLFVWITVWMLYKREDNIMLWRWRVECIDTVCSDSNERIMTNKYKNTNVLKSKFKICGLYLLFISVA